MFYSISAAQNREAVTLNVGDRVSIDHAVPTEEDGSSILDGYTLTIQGRTAPQPATPPAQEPDVPTEENPSAAA